MIQLLILFSAVIILCIIADKFSDKAGMPCLLLFMFVGILFGSDGIFKIPFDNYEVTEQICTICLIFIMFYGGFGVKVSAARPVFIRSGLLSSLGVLITSLLTCFFCRYALGWNFAESFLLGAVVGSTDAASVFSVLKSKNLNLKYNTASLLEIESGSNDPVAYMLTALGMLLISGEVTAGSVVIMVIRQIFFGVCLGFAVPYLSIFALKRLRLESEGMEMVFLTAVAAASYALSSALGGNGFLSAYLSGIIIGNSSIKNKKALVNYFDGITGLSQIVIFFLLGFLSMPHMLSGVFIPAVLIFLFMLIIARPAAVFAVLLPFKAKLRQCLLVSWSGLRGAASIVFAIMVVAGGIKTETDIFHTVFLVAIISVALQGSLLPFMAKKLDMVDEEGDVRKTFNDYVESSGLNLTKIVVTLNHPWANKEIKDIHMPMEFLVLSIRRGKQTIYPGGNTKIMVGDSLIVSVPAYNDRNRTVLREQTITKRHKWKDKPIYRLNIPENTLIAAIKRGDEFIIPQGHTEIKENDVVITCE
ncbi:MAG: potassium/proton antiporter [Clostridiales bacterium]|nr:potassium/proton antiporter [Clostridiales bacterium]